MCVRSFLKKNAEIFKMKFCSYYPAFPIFLLIIMTIIFRPVKEWHAIVFASPHKITNVGNVKNIYLQPLVVGGISM